MEGVTASHTYTRAGRYFVTLTVTDDQGLADSKTRSVQVSCPSTDLSPWRSAAVGEPAFAGGTRFEGEGEARCLRVCAGGKDIAGTSDECHFVYQEVTGDVMITAQVSELTAGERRAKVGVMLRESLEPGARHATMLIEYRNLGDQDRFRFARREQADERSRASSGDHAEIPNAWVQIRREGNEFIGSSSTDGTKWTEVGRVTLDLSEHILAGIAATGRDSKPDEPFNPLVARVCQLDFVPSALRAKFRRGDCNNDGSVDISDATCALNWLFAGASELGCVAALNTNGDDDVNIADTVSLLNFLFGGGLAPVAPFRDCGTSELEADARLGCVTGCQ